MFYSDKPVEKRQEDLLNRAIFSKQLANAITSYKQIDNFTVSLCGEWGCGKTSILNMVIQAIEESSKDVLPEESPIIIKFNPWNYSNRDQLISQFFQTILSELDKGDQNEKLKNIGEALQKYSSVLDYTTYIPVVGKYLEPIKSLLSGIGEKLYDVSQENENLVNRKNVVIKALKSQKQKLIIIIDDIDRLNNEQIKLIFQLVNSLAGFPNMIYLLSFDKEVVIRALEDEQKCNGAEYLEKIIQVPFDVPTAKLSLIHNVFFEKVNNIFVNIPCENFKNEYWSSVFTNCISPFINNIRDVNRILNVYRFRYGLMYNETNCIDLLAITTLQVCALDIYKWIVENINILSGSIQSAGGISGVKQKENKDNYILEFKMVYPTSPECMLKVIQTLFPKFSWLTGEYTHVNDSNNELRHDQKLASPERAEIYFSLSLENIKITKEEILVSINDYKSEELHDYFYELFRNEILYEYLQEMRAYISDIPEERLSLFFDEFINIQTIERNENNIINAPIAYMCKECNWQILSRINKEKRLELLLLAIDNANYMKLSILVDMVISIERSNGRIGESIDYNYRIVEEENIPLLKNNILKQIKSISENSNLLDIESFANICILWKELEVDSFSEYMNENLKYDQNVPKYLYFCASFWSGNNSNGWTFKEEYFSDFISKDTAYKSIRNLKGTIEFSNLNLKFKEIAIAYSLWYDLEDEDYYQISQEKVRKLLPEWERD